jgi:HlyD family secretion protein
VRSSVGWAQRRTAGSERMTARGRWWLSAGGAALVALAVLLGVHLYRRGEVTVQSGRVVREDLSSVVTASGEIRPKTFVNVGANAFGKIVKLYVKEGDRVRKGQMLAQIENVQPVADVEAARASQRAAEADYEAGLETLKARQSDLLRAQADQEQKQQDWTRAQKLYAAQLIAKKDFDAAKNSYESAVSAVAQARAQIAEATAASEAYKRRIAVQKANLLHNEDVLSKTEYRAPFDGVVTNLPVREGETVVVGIQNSPGSTLMTLADTSVITAEVMVDEADIVNVRVGQPAKISIDAIPNKKFAGVVSDIGNNALVRSTGVATSQATGSTQEAKDFKVVVTLTEVPEHLRPGLSATAKITTAHKSGVLAIPIQALTVRRKFELEPGKKTAAEMETAAELRAGREEVQGVFVIRGGRAEYVPVETGILGVSDIEVTHGLQEGEEIVTGSYKALRTLKPNARVRIDNSTPQLEEEEKS